MSIINKYYDRVKKVNSLVCVGLDSEYEKLGGFGQFEFNKKIIDQTHEYVASYKANIAFYEARGDQGLRELKQTTDYLRQHHPDIFLICDAKRGDIGNTNNGYITSILDWLGFDAMTLHPYMGRESLQPFLDRKDKFFFVLCRTSNSGAGEFQDEMYLKVAEHVAQWGDNCGLVVASHFAEVREVAGNMPFLVPGIGAQGLSVAEAVKGGNVIIHSARAIIFSNNPKNETMKLRNEINKYL